MLYTPVRFWPTDLEKVPRARMMEILAGGAQEPLAKRAKRGSVQAPNRTHAEFFEAPNAVVNQGAEQTSPGALRADAPPTNRRPLLQNGSSRGRQGRSSC